MMQRLVLLGPMGAGKTWIGTRVAKRLGWDLADSDQMIAATGVGPREIAERHGVAALHEREESVFRNALERDRVVIAAAASVADLPDIESLLRPPDTGVVLLTMDPSRTTGRAAGRHRRDITPQRAAELGRRRLDATGHLGDLRLDTTRLDETIAETMAATIVTLVEETRR